MDVSIAVSLIRGQMGAVVERAVNGAVETVLAEMLKVVGVKFEELKAQVALMKQDVASLQREKALKEKENDNIRAKLRYTELKLKYYRQGVEEELQQRATASAIVHIDPSNFHKGNASVCSIEKSPPSTTETRSSEGHLMRSIQECTPPQRMSRCAIGLPCNPDAGIAGSNTSVSLPVTPSNESVDSSGSTGRELLLSLFLAISPDLLLYSGEKEDMSQRQDEDQDGDVHEWTSTLQLHTDVTPPPAQPLAMDLWQQPVTASLSPDGSPHADRSSCPPAPQVKQEADEVICIKQEPEDEQELMATLLDCQIQQPHHSESQAQSSLPVCSEPLANQKISTATFSAARPSSYAMPEPTSALIKTAPNIMPHQAARPWTNDLTLYEEYKIRRNELRRRNLTRRRELEKTLPQPLLADMASPAFGARAAREDQTEGGQMAGKKETPGLSEPSSAATSIMQSTTESNTFLSNLTINSNSASLPFIPATSSSLLCRGPNLATHRP
ncbi:hypothetical protein D4764_01G0002740 [Takifugu flavidus]|uniref:Uncharacterized protein n=1 Tax=Takifugu flavidus TaxID=433684 RepID=A0A5C6PND2_9TELE|nr:hypothetical protein D4764_01G0002740 [Takifugu flavidus]